jgi:hypothetical protein
MRWLFLSSWLFLSLAIPIAVAWLNGSTYTFAFSVFTVGVVLYFTNIFLIRYFIKRRALLSLKDASGETIAGTGIIPKWVSALGLVGLGFIPSSLIVALFLWLGIINKAL